MTPQLSWTNVYAIGLILSCSPVLCSTSKLDFTLQSPFLVSTEAPLDFEYQYPATTLPVSNPTKSFWIHTPNANPLANVGSEGPLTQEADICVIGSGMSGVSVMYHLANSLVGSDKKLKAVVFEAREFCSGATGRNGGHLTPYSFFNFQSYQSKFSTEQAVKSLEMEMRTAREMIKIIEEEGLEDEVDIVHGGHVGLIDSEEAMKVAKFSYEGAKEAGLNVSDVEWLSADEVKQDYGAPYPAVKFIAHNFWPLKFVTQLYYLAESRAPNLSVSLHTKTPVTAVKPIPTSAQSHRTETIPRHWSLSTPRGSVQCSYVVHTTNGYASYLLPHLHGPVGIIPARGQVIGVRAAVSLSNLWRTSWGGIDDYYWFARPFNGSDGDTRAEPLVILGGGRHVLEGAEEYISDDSIVVKEVGNSLRGFLPSVFQKMFEERKEPEMEWTGIMGFTRMGDPFVGPVLDKSQTNEDLYAGQFIAAGFSGHGMPRAFSSAEAVAGIISSEITGTEWIQPDWLPDRYLTWNRDADGW